MVAHAIATPAEIGSASNLDTRLAYIVLVHGDPDHFGRMLRRLADPRVVFVVHVDAKADISPFREAAASVANVNFVKDRVRVMWAAFSVTEATLRAIEAASTVTGELCSHFVIISGADYPIVRNNEILGFFAAHRGRQFVRRFDLLACRDQHQVWRIRGRHFRQLADRHTLARRPLFVMERLLRAFPQRLPSGLTLASGSQWCALTRDCACFCAAFVRDNPTFRSLFRWSFASDEMVLHTVVENSGFVNEAAPIEPYVDVTTPGGPWYYANLHCLGPVTEITTAEQAHAILRHGSGKLFARKFNSARSAPALAVVDSALDADHSSRPAYATAEPDRLAGAQH